MGYIQPVKNGWLSMAYVDFVCPICECPHDEDQFNKAVRTRTKNNTEYLKCRGCKRRLDFTIDLNGDIQVWEP